MARHRPNHLSFPKNRKIQIVIARRAGEPLFIANDLPENFHLEY